MRLKRVLLPHDFMLPCICLLKDHVLSSLFLRLSKCPIYAVFRSEGALAAQVPSEALPT